MERVEDAQRESFHAGEIRIQKHFRSDKDVLRWAPRMLRKTITDQLTEFFEARPFVVLAVEDKETRDQWVTLVPGPPGFIVVAEDRTSLTIDTSAAPVDDPGLAVLARGHHVGLLGIQLATRRRNRINGSIVSISGSTLVLAVDMAYGNCPSSITVRDLVYPPPPSPPPPDDNDNDDDCHASTTSTTLTADQKEWIQTADTFFVGTGVTAADVETPSAERTVGQDASHRGGTPGFVTVRESIGGDVIIEWEERIGNRLFNTLGNLALNPQIGLVFINFKTGSLLHITGTASVTWGDTWDSPQVSSPPTVSVTINHIISHPSALPFRWNPRPDTAIHAVLVRVTIESDDVTSFVFLPIEPPAIPVVYSPGQHIEASFFLDTGLTSRSYSLSSEPRGGALRISVKRHGKGKVSRYLHDTIQVGDSVLVSPPSGTFTLPPRPSPEDSPWASLVVVSAGIDITPLLPIVSASDSEHYSEVVVVSAARDGAHAPLVSEMADRVALLENGHHTIVFSRPRPSLDILGRDFDLQGRVTPSLLSSLLSPEASSSPSSAASSPSSAATATYVLCGPPSFLSDLSSTLASSGVPETLIHYEEF